MPAAHRSAGMQSVGFNPSNGIGVVHALIRLEARIREAKFQSLKRDRGGSCRKGRFGKKKNPMFQSLKRDRGGSCIGKLSFVNA